MSKNINKWGVYSTPIIVDYKGDLTKDWFVKYHWQPFEGEAGWRQTRGGINQYKTLKDRRKKAESYRNTVESMLSKDYNPLFKKYLKEIPISDRWANMELPQALVEGLSIKKGISSVTRKQYEYSIKYFTEAYHRLSLVVKVKDVRPSHISMVLEEYQCFKNKPNTSYNAKLRHISAVLDKVYRLADLLYNPALPVESKPTKKTAGFKMPTESQKKDLKKLDIVNPRIFTVALVIYYTGIRPKEVLKLKVGDIIEGHFVILPDPEKENSKTRVKGIVPIPAQLMERLNKMNLHTFPADYYIFGKPNEGKRTYADFEKYYLPSPYAIKRVHFSQEWKDLVIDGMGINANAYGMKHRGAVDSKKAGMSMEALREKFRHRSIKTTEIYLEGLINVYSEEILEKSPDF